MNKMKLNIQLMADEQTGLDFNALSQSANEIISVVGPHIAELATEIASSVNSLVTSEEFKTLSSEAILTAVSLITPYMSGFDEELSTLGNFVINVVQSYELSDETLRKEFEEWGNQIQSSITGIKSSATAAPAGDYNLGTYLTDMSKTTREGVGLATEAIVNTNKLISNSTGMSVVDTLATVTQSAAGSFGTLLTGAAETAKKFIGFLTGGIA